jgi:tRNA(Ile)-lysidine synthase
VKKIAESRKLSIETAARNLRIDSLLRIAKNNNCRLIATAHHKDDNAETVIHRLARGTGFKGLCGIWPARTFTDDIVFVRPFLGVTRSNILEYLEQQDLKWCVDKTNYNCTIKRNFIRHRLIPHIQKDCSKSVSQLLFDLSKHARSFHLLVCSRANEVWPEAADCEDGRVLLNLEIFKPESEPVKIELITKSLSEIRCGLADLTRHHFKKILQLADSKTSGVGIELPNGFTVGYEYGRLIFAKAYQDTKGRAKKRCQLQIPGRTRFGDHLIEAAIINADIAGFEKFKSGKNSFIEWLDLDKLKLPLEIRIRKEGDRFQPLGLAREKKLGKFLTDQRVPQRIRKKVLVVTDSEKIVWLWPIRLSEQARVSPKARKILQLQITYASVEK